MIVILNIVILHMCHALSVFTVTNQANSGAYTVTDALMK